MSSTHTSRAERRIKRVLEHRLRLNEQITERKLLFEAMNERTMENLLRMMSNGETEPTGFVMNRECDENDYFRNTELFQQEASRFLDAMYAIDAEYCDPDGVSELLAHAEQLTLFNDTSNVLEVAVSFDTTETITISTINQHSVKEVEPINLEIVEELTALPTEVQLEVTQHLTCAEKIIASAYTGVAVRPCAPPLEVQYHPDRRSGVTNYCIGTGDDFGTVVTCHTHHRGHCNHSAMDKTFSWKEIQQDAYKAHRPRFKKREFSRADLKSSTSLPFTGIYSEPVRYRRPRTCICQSRLFYEATRIRYTSMIAALRHVGCRPPQRRHKCVLGLVPKAHSSCGEG